MINFRKEAWTALCISFFLTSGALANPVLDNVGSGNVTVNQAPNVTTINQTSQKAILNWQSFNIGSGEATHFVQPAGGIALNRISPVQGASQIYGVLTATGQIILVNPAGIYFGPGAYVNVGGMIATTSNISDKNFLSGHYVFDQPSPFANPQIVNAGTIIAAEHGLVALVGPNVTNNGMIRANLGSVVLAAGDVFTVDLSGNGMINFEVAQAPSSHAESITNTGKLIANGGEILVTAQQASGVLDHVINIQGTLQAQSVYQQQGEIIISGDLQLSFVDVAANLDVSGFGAGEKGGTVNITGHNILLEPAANINASGNAGGGNVNIGGNLHGAGPLPNANAVVMEQGAVINANAVATGNGGQVVLWSEAATRVAGSISAKGGSESGNGGMVETSSHNFLEASNALVNTSAAKGETGTWLLDPADVTISTGSDANYTDVSNIFEPNSGAATATVNTTTLDNALANNSITITTTNNGTSGGALGNILVSNAITWSSGNTLTLTAANAITINAAITGTNGSLVLSAANTSNSITTGSGGTINVKNFNLAQGQWTQIMNPLPAFTVSNNFQINSGTLPGASVQFVRAISGNGSSGSPFLVTDVYGLQGIGSSVGTLGVDWGLGASIDASSTSTWNSGAGFIPIGNGTNKFVGIFNGNTGYISGLTINVASNIGGDVGLFGDTNGATINNLNVVGASVSVSAAQSGTPTGATSVGILAGNMQGTSTVTNDYTSGTVNVTVANSIVGGLIGAAGDTGSDNVAITGSGSTAAVNVNFGGSSGAVYVGGLVGLLEGASSVNTSWANAPVTATLTADTNFALLGGLLGLATTTGSSADNYSIGSVTVTGYGGAGTNLAVGGFVGEDDSLLTRSYSTGAVSANTGTAVGGFAGLVHSASGSITKSFWDTATSGRSSGAGTLSSGGSTTNLTGGCFAGGSCTNGGTANLSASSTYSSSPYSWSIGTSGTTWLIYNGQTRPMLASQSQSVVYTPYSLQLIGINTTTAAAAYNQVYNINLSGITNAADVWGGVSWVPIGNSTSTPFTGTYTAFNSSTISNLTLTSAGSANGLGLFGIVNGSGMQISNVNVSGSMVLNALTNNAGGLVGIMFTSGGAASGGTLSNDISSVNISSSGGGTSSATVGGLVGQVQANSTVTSSSWTGSSIALGSGSTFTGGLAGLNAGSISSSSTSTGTVVGGNYVGGLVGDSSNSISNSTSGASVSGVTYIGGLVGYNAGTISSTGAGLTAATGSSTGSGTDIGGLVGYNNGTIAPAAQGYITASGSVSYTGALTQVNIGGLVGVNDTSGVLSNLTNTISVSSSNAEVMGGIVGLNSGTISNVYNSGSIFGYSNVGGIVGYQNAGSLTNAYNTGVIEGSFQAAGGIAGQLFSSTVNKVYNLGEVINDGVTASPNAFGGVVGWVSGSVSLTNAYNNGYVSATQGGQSGTQVGGIIGNANSLASSTLGFLYNTGYVQGSSASSTGGLIGTITAGTPTYSGTSYFNADTSGPSSAVGTGSTCTGTCASNLLSSNTSAMQTQSTFTGWDFSTTWSIIANTSYPYLQAAYSTTPRVVTTTSSAAGGTPVSLYVNASPLDLTYTGNNGAAYFLEGNNLISGINHTIADGDLLYAFFNQTSPVVSNAIAIAPSSGGQMGFSNSLTLAASTLTVGLASSSATFTPAQLASAVGAESHALFTVDGSNDLTMNSGDSLAISSPTSLSLPANLTTSGGGTTIISGSGVGGAGALISNSALGQINSTITLAGDSTIATNSSSDELALFNTISGSHNLTYMTGIFNILGSNTYSGSTTVNGGSLILSADSALGTPPSTATPGSLTLLNGGSITPDASFTLNSNRGILLGTGGGEINPISGSTLTYGGIIAGSSLSILGDDSGSGVTLSGANTYSGGTTVEDATLSISADNNLGAAPGTATPGSLTLDIDGTLATTATFTLNSNRGISLGSSSASSFIAVNPGTTLTYGGIMTGNDSLNVSGGTLVLSGANTNSGGVNITSGILNAQNSNALGTSGVSVSSGAELLLGASGNPVTLPSGNTLSLAGTGVSGAGALATQGSTADTVNGTITLTGDTTISATGSGDTLTLNGTIDGTHNLTLAGSGAIALNNYVGSNQTLSSFTSSSSGSTSVGLGVFTNGDQIYNNPLTITASGSQLATESTGSITFNSTVTIDPSASLWVNSANNITFNGAVSGETLTLDANPLATSITTGAGGSMNLVNFDLDTGQWLQTSATLPAFSVSNDFEIAGGAMPGSSAQFIRSASDTGDGSSGNPYVIADIYGLQGIGSTSTTLSAAYNLSTSLDASGTVNWNGGAGFVPIGSSGTNFSGTFNGQGNTISNLVINLPSSSQVGLFGETGSSASISNITISNPTITGFLDVGALAGNNSGAITDAISSGGTVSGSQNVGGLIGTMAAGTLTSTGLGHVTSSTTVDANVGSTGSIGSVGGLIGTNEVDITPAAQGDITATGNVSSTSTALSADIGGFVGASFGNLSNVGATGEVSAPSAGDVGGFAGLNGATATNVYATGDVTGSSGVGGLAGENQGTITATGAISSTQGLTYYAGGTVTGANKVGGLVGQNEGNITPPAQGYVTASGTLVGSVDQGSEFGGIVGYNDPLGVISNMTNKINITNMPDNFDIGGIAGYNEGIISDTYNAANISGDDAIGGIVGYQSTGGFGPGIYSVSDSYNSGTITGGTDTAFPTDGHAGGVIGLVEDNAQALINKVYNIGNVVNGSTATPNDFGGVVGYLGFNNSLTNAYNNGYVSAGSAGTNVGGVVGEANLASSSPYQIGFWYNTGYVNGASGVGGLIGFVDASPTPIFAGTSYFNSDTSGPSGLAAASNYSNANLASANTAAMQTQSTYSGWDFAGTWNIIASTSYPYLRDFYSSTPRVISANSSALGGTPISLYVGGTSFDAASTGYNGASYFLEGSNLVSGVNNTVADGSSVYMFINQNSGTLSNAIAFAPGSGAAMNMNLAANTLTVGLAGTSETISNTDIENAANGESHALFTVSSNNLTMNSGDNFVVTTPTTYSVVGNLTTTGGGTVTIAGPVAGGGNSFVLTVDGASSISGNMSNLSGFTKSGAGTLTLSGTNTYSGATSVTAGILQAGAANTFSPNSAVSLANTAGVALDLNNFSNSIASLAGGGVTGGNVTLGSGTLTIANSNNGSSTSYAGAISGTGGLTINLTGTSSPVQILSGSNSYSGTTTISAGTLRASAANTLSSSSAVSLANVAGAVLDLNNFSNSIASLAGGGGTGGNVTLGSGTLTIANSTNGSSTSYAGAISGTGGLTINLTGTSSPVQILTGTSNSYSGTTNISAGTLRAGAANVFSANSAVSLANIAGAALDLNNFSNSIASLAGGGTTGGNVSLGSGTLTIANSTNGSSTSYAGAISGTGGLTINLTGTSSPVQILTGTSNSYSGTTNISAGTLRAGAANVFSANSAVSLANVAGAALDLNNFSNSIASLAGGGTTGGNVSLGSGTLTIANSTNGSSTSYAGAISGTGGLTINLTGTGSPVQTLSGSNSYSGTTNISAGTLQAGAANALSSSSAVSLANVAGVNLNLNNFSNSIASLAGGGTTGGNVTLGSGTLTIANSTNGSSTSYAGAISGTGGLTINLTGTGSPVQILTGTSNSYSGATNISAGTLQAGAANALSANSAVSLANVVGAALDLNNFSNSIASLAGGGTTGGNVTLGSGTLTIANSINGSSTSYAGAISGTGGLTINLTGTGSPVQTLSGSNSYSGTTNISAGTLQAGAANALSSSSAVSLANVAGAALDLNNFSNSIASLAGGGTTGGNVSLGSGTLTIANSTNGSSTSYAGAISGTGGLTINLTGTGSPVETLSGTNLYTGTTTINAGTLAAASAGALGPSGGGSILLTPSASNTAILDLSAISSLTNTNGAINFNSSAAGSTAQMLTNAAITMGNAVGLTGTANQFNVAASTTELDGAITGTGGFTKLGSGILLFGGSSNSYSGTTTVSAGTLQAGAANALSSASAISLANSAGVTLNLNNFSNSIASLAGGGTTGGNVSLGSGTLTIANSTNGSSTSYAGAISGTGGLTINLTGTGSPVQILTGTSNSYSGATNISAGSLQAGAANALSANSAVSLANVAGASLNLNNFSNSIASLAGGGGTGGNVSLGSGTLTIANSTNGSSTSYAGAISGTGGLTINLTGTGSPVQTLSGSNSYSGTTNVSAGTLQAGAANALSANSAVSLANVAGAALALNNFSNSIASLAGGGTTGGNVTLGSGTLTIANSTNGSSTSYAGAISGTGGLTINLTGTGSPVEILTGTSNSYSGTTNISAGTLQVGAVNALSANSAVSLANVAGVDLNLNNFSNSIASLAGGGTTGGNVTLGSGTLTIANSINGSSTNYAGAISGTGGLTINLTGTGSPVQTLSGSNSYSGATNVSAGTLQAGAANALSANSAVSLANVAGAALALNNFSNSIASLAGGGTTGGNVSLGSGTLTIANSTNGSSTSYAGVISGSGGLTINLTGTGSPVETLSGTNLYTGTTSIDAGTLAATSAGALGPSGGGSILLTPSASNTALLDLSALSSLTNTNGAINFNSSAAGSTAEMLTNAAITLGNAVGLTGTTNQFNVAASTTELDGAITGTGGFTKLGSGILLLGGGSNNYSGTTTVSAGTLQAGAANALSSASAISLANSAGVTLNLNNFSNSIASLAGGGVTGGNVSLGSGTLTIANSTNGSSTNYAGVISGTGGLTINLTGTGSPVQSLSGGNTYSGTTNISAGTLQAGAANALSASSAVSLANVAGSSLSLNNFSNSIISLAGGGATGGNVSLGSGTLTIANSNNGSSTSYAGAISGSGNLVINLTGTGSPVETLSGTSTYTGTTTIDAGTLTANSAGALGPSNGGNIFLTSSAANTAILNVSAISSLTNTNGAINFNSSAAGSSTELLTSAAFTLANAVGLTGTANQFNVAANIIQMNGAVTGAGSLTKLGSGTMVLNGAGSSYSGGTNINNGTVTVASSAGLGSGIVSMTPSAAGSVLLNLTGLSSLSDTNTINLNSGAAGSTAQVNTTAAITLSNNIGLSGSNNIFDVSANTTTLSGSITGTGALIANGSGTLVLSGNNLYQGGTTVNGGTLSAASATALGNAAGSVVMNTGTTLLVSGATLGNDIVLNNATLNETGTGSLTGAITLGDNTNDVINSSGAFGLNGNLNGLTSGTAGLTLGGTGSVTLSGNMGAVNPLASLVFNTTVNLSGNVSLSAATVSLNNGVSGGSNNLAVNGSSVTVAGPVTANNFTVTGTGVSNTLSLDSGSTQTWNVSGANAGGIAASGIAGSGTFGNIQNISGGSEINNVTLGNAGSLSGSINGGSSGNNTFTGPNGIAATFDITSANAMTVSGVSRLVGLSNFQNVNGGSSGNTFVFENGASLSGAVNGGSLASTNTLDYHNYTSPVTAVLTSNQYNGNVNNNGSPITGYSNINNLVGNATYDLLLVTDAQSPKLVLTGPNTGYVADPLFFTGWQTNVIPTPTPAPAPAPAPTPTNDANPQVSSIIQQPQSNNNSSDNGSTLGAVSSSNVAASSLNQNIDTVADTLQSGYDTSLSNVKVNPYCYQAN